MTTKSMTTRQESSKWRDILDDLVGEIKDGKYAQQRGGDEILFAV